MCEEQKMKSDQVLDCLGLYCPMPIVRTAQSMKQLASGKVLEVIADDKGFVEDIKAWCTMTKNECLAIQENGPEIRAYIKKAG
jgi:tRNA 2-thiouridine synthesizing protein A